MVVAVVESFRYLHTRHHAVEQVIHTAYGHQFQLFGTYLIGAADQVLAALHDAVTRYDDLADLRVGFELDFDCFLSGDSDFAGLHTDVGDRDDDDLARIGDRQREFSVRVGVNSFRSAFDHNRCSDQRGALCVENLSADFAGRTLECGLCL